ncbi:DUF2254 domain-containing protein [Dyella sp.]|jgi:uncharacterized membrane protein|uniref:DUF2254 domain-containing protein n=1 Tax=Dyella sp. TaxID=1869338 RepID=UPI002D78EDBC|nr:DUF2254 domain-containing protein [Dyella sp.]HET6431047.1 DUF2254 domain-containing protein [Dyella sp.]
MKAHWRLWLVGITRRLWFRSTLYGAGAVVTALLGAVAKPLLPHGIAAQIGASAVGNILGILASSMLAVTTFSLSTMVAAYAAASSSATPRAATLLIEDSAAQRALATFVGAFLFSIVGLIALSTGIYGDSGRLILFGATVLVIIMIVGTLLRWIDQLSRLGRVTETIDRVEAATRKAMAKMIKQPWLGAQPYVPPPEGAVAVESRKVGYVAYIDVERLQSVAEREKLQVWAEVAPGSFVAPGRPVARLAAPVDEDIAHALAEAFVIDDTRNFEQDPRFGIIVLTEIAQRALSPAVNDPGTAIDIIGTVTRLLSQWARDRLEGGEQEILHDRVFMRALLESDYFDDIFTPLARDAAPLLEVSIRLQKSLATLGQMGYPPYRSAASAHAERALAFAADKALLANDMDRLRALARWCQPPA